MSITQVSDHTGYDETATLSGAPFRRGDRISVISPEGVRFVAKVDTVTARPTGDFAILAAIKEPRRYRNHLLTTVVDSRGCATPPLRPAV